MVLVQILLPVFYNDGQQVEVERFAEVRVTLTDRFGGVTAYLRTAAAGSWKRDDGTIDRDRMVMVEVSAADLDRRWWRSYRETLQRAFKQEVVLIRALQIEAL